MSGEQPTKVQYHNHIVIGLGGTGGQALRQFRKELFQRYRDKLPHGVRLEYLYVDSSESDLNESESWRVLGSSVQLPNDSRLLIAVPNLRMMIENAPQFPGISSWIGSPAVWRNYLDNLQGLRAAGGQRRRMGRVLFAANVSRFNQQIAQLYSRITTGSAGRSGSEGVTFHVVCGLAGGTGSGSIVDVAIQLGKFIRERAADRKDRILLYTLLPEENPVGGRAERYYFANGYVALLELNALSVGRALPHDVADPRGRRLEASQFSAFNGCYVCTNKTETGTIYDVQEMPGLIASFLFQKIVAVGDSGSWNALVRQENSENGNSAPEPRALEGAGPHAAAPPPERSVRFLSFGIKRVAVPEQEIKEHLAYSFARQAILQLRFNNWTDAFGFIDTPKNNDHAAYRGPALLEAFRMTDDHLLLSKPVLDSDQSMQWKPIEEFWQIYLGRLFEDVVGSSDKNYVVQDLIAKATEWFSSGYRNVGAGTFYQRKSATVTQEAREILRLIEDHLFKEWLQGGVAMTGIAGSKDADHPVRGIMQVLREEVEERKIACLASVPQSESLIKELMLTLDVIEGEYAKVGALDILRKRGRLQTEAGRVLEELLIVRTRALGYQYAVRLCDALLRELEELAGRLTACSAILQNALELFDEGIRDRCQDRGPPDFGKGFVKFYDADNVRRVTQQLVLDREVQAAQAGAVRKAIRERMTSQRPTFRELIEQVSLHQLGQVLEQQSFERSQLAHDALGLNAHEQLFGLSILDQILVKYPTRDARKQFAESVIPQASTLARIDETEARNASANPHPNDILRRSLSVIGAGLTAASANASAPVAVEELKSELRGALKTAVETFAFVEAPDQTSDLTFISLSNLMPLRTVEHMSFLGRKYNEITRGRTVAPEDALFLHIEGDGSELPGLYPPTMEQIRSKARGALLLGGALAVLLEQVDPRTGRKSWTLTETDEYGVPVSAVSYGDNFIQALTTIDGPKLRVLDSAVEGKLRSEELLHEAKKKELVALVAKRLQELLPLCGNSVQHPEYVAYTEAYRAIRARMIGN